MSKKAPVMTKAGLMKAIESSKVAMRSKGKIMELMIAEKEGRLVEYLLPELKKRGYDKDSLLKLGADFGEEPVESESSESEPPEPEKPLTFKERIIEQICDLIGLGESIPLGNFDDEFPTSAYVFSDEVGITLTDPLLREDVRNALKSKNSDEVSEIFHELKEAMEEENAALVRSRIKAAAEAKKEAEKAKADAWKKKTDKKREKRHARAISKELKNFDPKAAENKQEKRISEKLRNFDAAGENILNMDKLADFAADIDKKEKDFAADLEKKDQEEDDGPPPFPLVHRNVTIVGEKGFVLETPRGEKKGGPIDFTEPPDENAEKEKQETPDEKTEVEEAKQTEDVTAAKKEPDQRASFSAKRVENKREAETKDAKVSTAEEVKENLKKGEKTEDDSKKKEDEKKDDGIEKLNKDGKDDSEEQPIIADTKRRDTLTAVNSPKPRRSILKRTGPLGELPGGALIDKSELSLINSNSISSSHSSEKRKRDDSPEKADSSDDSKAGMKKRKPNADEASPGTKKTDETDRNTSSVPAEGSDNEKEKRADSPAPSESKATSNAPSIGEQAILSEIQTMESAEPGCCENNCTIS